jgi:Kef-type K+ transport system membrane component KefB
VVGFFLALFLMLASAWLLGEALHRIGQPALVGQLLAGVLIGPSLLNIVLPTADLSAIEQVALFFIMLLAGLVVKPDRIVAAGRRGGIVSFIAFVCPFVAGVVVARGFGVGPVASLTVGLTISITAVPVNAIILMELGLLDSELGTTVIAAGVIEAVIAFVGLTMIEQFAVGVSIDAYASITVAVLKVTVFLVAVLACERFLRTNSTRVIKFTERFAPKIQTQGSFIAILLIFAVGVSLLAEWAGVQLVIGAFFAGLLVSELAGADALAKGSDVIRGVTFGFFGPLAFSFIGIEFVISSIGGILFLVGVVLAVAVAGKFLGGYLGAKIANFSSTESMTIGFLMNSRGFVELVVAATAYQLGLIDQSIFSMVVAVGIIATIISPIASRITIRRDHRRLKSLDSAE